MHSPLPDPRPGEPEPYESPAEVAGDLNVSLLGVVEPLDPELLSPFALPELVDPGTRYDAIVDRVELLSGQMPVRLLGCLGLEDDALRYRLAANLAARLARGGRRITLVEAEFSRSMLATPTGERDGFIDMLLYGCSFPAVARPSGIAGVSVITAGSHPWSGEPIHGDEWERVLGSFRNHSDLTLLVASTAIPAPVLSMMARRLDWILIAFALNRGSRHAIRCSYLTLWDMDAPILGLVAETARTAGWTDERESDVARASAGEVAGSGAGEDLGVREREVEPILDEIDSGHVVVRRGETGARGAPGSAFHWGRSFLESEADESESRAASPAMDAPESRAASPGATTPPAWEAARSGTDRAPAAWDPFATGTEADAEVVIREAREFEAGAAELWQEEVARLRPAAAGKSSFGVPSDEAPESPLPHLAEPRAEPPAASETEIDGERVESLPSHGADDIAAGEESDTETERSFESAWERAMGASPVVETPSDREESTPVSNLSSAIAGVPPLLHAPGWPGVDDAGREMEEESAPPQPEIGEWPRYEPERGGESERAEVEREEIEPQELERQELERTEPETLELDRAEWIGAEPETVELARPEFESAEPETVELDRAEFMGTESERTDPREPDWPPGIAPPAPVAPRGGEVRDAINELEKELIGEHTRELVAKEPNRAPWRVLVPGAIIGILALLFWAYQNEIIRFEPKPPHPSESGSPGLSQRVQVPPAKPGGENPAAAKVPSASEPAGSPAAPSASTPPAGVPPSSGATPPQGAPPTVKPAPTKPSPAEQPAPNVAPPAPGATPSQPPEESAHAMTPPGESLTGFGVQVSSFQTEARAREDLARYQKIGYKGVIITVEVPGRGKRRRVILGPYPTQEEAASVASAIREDGLSPEAQAVPLGR